MTMIQKMHAGCSPRSSTLPDDARQSNTIFIKRDAFQSEKLYMPHSMTIQLKI